MTYFSTVSHVMSAMTGQRLGLPMFLRNRRRLPVRRYKYQNSHSACRHVETTFRTLISLGATSMSINVLR